MTESLQAFGPELAAAVADRLERGDMLAYAHRDYCGMGLRYADGGYHYGEVWDGSLPTAAELRQWGFVSAQPPLQSFSSRQEFVGWLSAQSDESLHGRELDSAWMIGNQRLDRQRLQAFAEGALPLPTR